MRRQLFYLFEIDPIKVPIHTPTKIVIVKKANPIPSQLPTAILLKIINPIQIRLNTMAIESKTFLETLRAIINIPIANTIPQSNIGVHPSNIKASI